MSTIEGDENDSSSPVNTPTSTGKDDEINLTSTRSGATGDSKGGGSKVVFLLKAAGGAPILKRKKWELPRSKTMGHIVEFLKKYLQLDAQQQQLFLYVNQAFSPALDTTIGSVYDCFNSEGTLVLHYALTEAWG